MATASKDVFHEGEIAVQERAGERGMAVRTGAMVRETVMEAALPFLAQQRTVAIAAEGSDGRLRASLWLGRPGFVASPDGRAVTITRALQRMGGGDPVLAHLREGGNVGLLAIDLGSRRRLRINGRVSVITTDAIAIDVRESFPNCPKYIQRRRLHEETGARAPGSDATGVALDGPRRALIERADTLFVASHHPVRGADVSHRGGAQGFVRVVGSRTLRIPDYPGNSLFQTLGNFEVDGRAGVVVVDFGGGRLLSMTGQATLSFGAEDPQHPTGGTGRYWELAVEEWLEHAMPAAYRWERLDPSPFNPPPSGEA
jgi:predicted pyridoxine 5'-phosphate oxidase superfamily flavin-nucleotide-binding protein